MVIVLKEETELDALPYIKTFNKIYGTHIVYAENGVSSIEKYIDEHPDEDRIFFISKFLKDTIHVTPIIFKRSRSNKKFYNKK